MSYRRISQREAHKLRRRVRELERILEVQQKRWSSEWPSSTVLHRLTVDQETQAVVKTARALRHACVVTLQDNSRLTFFGVQLP